VVEKGVGGWWLRVRRKGREKGEKGEKGGGINLQS
jgi:hypothetical protein